jgi:predicted O-methyltransferase YrrM
LSDNGRVAEFPNWFTGGVARDNFRKLLEPYKGQQNLQFLQLGAYTGDATVWLLDNVLSDETSHLTDVDTWQGSDEIAHHDINFSDVEQVYDSKTSHYKNLTKFKGTTIEWLKAAPFDYYDFIYVDADHTAAGVLIDAELSFLSVKPGGIIAFDDYLWTEGRGAHLEPKSGINVFIDRHKEDLEIIHNEYQMWVVRLK